MKFGAYLGVNLYSGTRVIDALLYTEDLGSNGLAYTLAFIVNDTALIFSVTKGRSE